MTKLTQYPGFDLADMDISCCFEACQPQQKCAVDGCTSLCLRRTLWFLCLLGVKAKCWIPLCEMHEPRITDEYPDPDEEE